MRIGGKREDREVNVLIYHLFVCLFISLFLYFFISLFIIQLASDAEL